MKRILVVFILVLFVGTILYFFVGPKDKNAQNTVKQLQKVTLQLNWVHQAQFAGLYVAKEKGYYKEAGLDVDIKEYTDGLDQTQAVASGSADFAVSTPVELLSGIQSGQQVKALAVIYQQAPLAFVSLKKSGIKTPSDFKGKQLGSKGGNKESHVKYLALMNRYNIKRPRQRL